MYVKSQFLTESGKILPPGPPSRLPRLGGLPSKVSPVKLGFRKLGGPSRTPRSLGNSGRAPRKCRALNPQGPGTGWRLPWSVLTGGRCREAEGGAREGVPPFPVAAETAAPTLEREHVNSPENRPRTEDRLEGKEPGGRPPTPEREQRGPPPRAPPPPGSLRNLTPTLRSFPDKEPTVLGAFSPFFLINTAAPSLFKNAFKRHKATLGRPPASADPGWAAHEHRHCLLSRSDNATAAAAVPRGVRLPLSTGSGRPARTRREQLPGAGALCCPLARVCATRSP